MKDILFIILKYYAIIGIVCAAFMTVWISILSVKADDILARGNTVSIDQGPTFNPSCNRMRMFDYFVLYRGFGMSVIAFFVWPYLLYLTIKSPSWLNMVKEIKGQ